jgi:hypothetical protein
LKVFFPFSAVSLIAPKRRREKNKSLALSLRQQKNVVIAKWKSQFSLFYWRRCAGRKIG